MPKMTYRGVKIIDWKGVHTESGQYVEANMAADFSDPIRREMGWHIGDELESLFPKLADKEPATLKRAAMLFPTGVKSMGLAGDVAVRSLELIPNGKDLEKFRTTLDCNQISWFNLVRTKQPNGTFVYELRFTAIILNGVTAAQKIASYIEGVGDKPAQMPVGYDVQEDLPLEEGEAEDAQERLISDEQAADTAAADEDTPRTSPPKSHQRKRADAPGARRGAEQIPDPVVQ